MPYDFLPLSAQRSVITGQSSQAAPMGATLSVTYTGAVTHAVLAAPSAVTHQARARILGGSSAASALAWGRSPAGPSAGWHNLRHPFNARNPTHPTPTSGQHAPARGEA